MVRKLIAWALDNPLVVVLFAVFLAGVGGYSFLNVNVEAYPDPAGDRGGDRAVPRRLRTGGRAAGDDSPGSDIRWHARLEEDQQQIAVRAERPQDDLELRQSVLLSDSPPGSHQPDVDDQPAAAG